VLYAARAPVLAHCPTTPLETPHFGDQKFNSMLWHTPDDLLIGLGHVRVLVAKQVIHFLILVWLHLRVAFHGFCVRIPWNEGARQ
jgi:hypothetical protein